jgi:hypothetical protein
VLPIISWITMVVAIVGVAVSLAHNTGEYILKGGLLWLEIFYTTSFVTNVLGTGIQELLSLANPSLTFYRSAGIPYMESPKGRRYFSSERHEI